MFWYHTLDHSTYELIIERKILFMCNFELWENVSLSGLRKWPLNRRREL